ncbi:membrane-spanning 4-domains subfamily A member 4D-like [Pelobates fuscus]|uniref:membrane-spanning 4-domains subfamily A member 4D-like n=1 Tax=Pelobates fuscus TaxID=191477 RepID=UPI002FE4A29F
MTSPPTALTMIPQFNGIPLTQSMALPAATTNQSYTVLKRGQPKALGVTQIVLTFLQISLGTVFYFTDPYDYNISLYAGICFWGSIFYIISGSLSVVVENRPSPSKVKAFLAMNIISSVVSLVAVFLCLTDLCISITKCDEDDDDYNHNHKCRDYNYYLLNRNRATVLSFLIIASLLQFCVSVSLSIFGCKSLKRDSKAPTQVPVLQNDYEFSGPNVIPGFGSPPPYTYPNPMQNMENNGIGMPVIYASAPAPEPTKM